MRIIDTLKQIPEPQIYRRENRNCYYDTYRKKLIEITPEETVRQKVAALFEKEYHVPKAMISLETPLSYYVDGASGRADIVIHSRDENRGCIVPLTIIECKNSDVFLTDKVADQAIRYCDTLTGKYFVITNGIDLEIAAYDEETGTYKYLDSILTYEEMVDCSYSVPEGDETEFVRFTMEELQDQNKLREYNELGSWIFGEGTAGLLRSFAVNFFQALLDVQHKLPKISRRNFTLIEDIGPRFMDYGNAGGGHYVGDYRSFLVKDSDDEPQIVSVSMFGTDSGFRNENRNSYTSLVVSVDRFKTSHNSLQYNVDRFAVVKPDGKVQFRHNGQMGNHKNEQVVNAVSVYGEGVQLSEGAILIGELDASKLIYLNDPLTAEFVYNLIEYALIREKVRKK